VRIGQGWDIHRLVDGRPLRLGGITVPSSRGLLGHSDGDVVLHAVADALLGALAAGDIGQHFPDTDPRYRGIDSAKLLSHVVRLVGRRGYQVGNVDVTILAERPKLAPHMAAIQERLAGLLGVAADAVGLKAKTMEGLGAIGAGEAMAALAVATVGPRGRTTRVRRSGARRPPLRTTARPAKPRVAKPRRPA
jgi:2-C-methyl-D-erythritol 2,4-cyclodiphosphate synthase